MILFLSFWSVESSLLFLALHISNRPHCGPLHNYKILVSLLSHTHAPYILHTCYFLCKIWTIWTVYHNFTLHTENLLNLLRDVLCFWYLIEITSYLFVHIFLLFELINVSWTIAVHLHVTYLVSFGYCFFPQVYLLFCFDYKCTMSISISSDVYCLVFVVILI